MTRKFPLYYTEPLFLSHTERLITVLKGKTQKEIADMMSLSAALAALNYHRYRQFQLPFSVENATPAIFAFKGDVYDGLAVNHFSLKALEYVKDHLLILSGLYGLLRPYDLMQAYRLEMGTALPTQWGKNLYEFWGHLITSHIESCIQTAKHSYLINAASKEYSRVIDQSKLSVPMIEVIFKEKKQDQYRIVMIYAKRARGKIARFIQENQIENLDALKQFDEDGYCYSKTLSNANQMVFTR